MFALISDLHSNVPALEAVFAKIDALGIEDVRCLGDIVGYGAEPERCLDMVRERCRFSLRGNHDWGMFDGLDEFNSLAREALLWTRRRLRPGLNPKRWGRWRYLKNLPERMYEDGDLFVHASPRDPIREYVLKSDGFLNPEKLEDLFARFEGRCFLGHTHQPGFTGEDLRFHAATGDGAVLKLPEGKAMINAGSVGQPRDGDNRACFCVVDAETVTYHRVPYDIEKAQHLILQAGLSPFLAERLERGR